jgi:molybdenum cofactor cytidylyltransferase
MGQPKHLLLLEGKPVIGHCLDNIAAAGIDEIVVVVGPHFGRAAKALSRGAVSVVVNEERSSDMAGSVRVGLQALDQSCTGVLVCLADHPLASAGAMQTLMLAHVRSPEKIVIPAHNGRRGHPTLFPTSILNEIFVMNTLRDIVRKDRGRVRIVDVADQGVILDMDTPEDYARVRNCLTGSRTRAAGDCAP